MHKLDRLLNLEFEKYKVWAYLREPLTNEEEQEYQFLKTELMQESDDYHALMMDVQSEILTIINTCELNNIKNNADIGQFVSKIDWNQIINDISCWNQRENGFNNIETFKQLKELKSIIQVNDK